MTAGVGKLLTMMVSRETQKIEKDKDSKAHDSKVIEQEEVDEAGDSKEKTEEDLTHDGTFVPERA